MLVIVVRAGAVLSAHVHYGNGPPSFLEENCLEISKIWNPVFVGDLFLEDFLEDFSRGFFLKKGVKQLMHEWPV
jgi:hypothetical protein